MEKRKVGFYTLGCKVNSFDTEAMAELFEKRGYSVVPFSEYADVYVVNTCTVTHLGDRKSRNILRRARRHNPDAIIVAAGCYAQVAPEEVSAIEEVNMIIGTQDRLGIVDAVEDFKRNDCHNNFVKDNTSGRDFEDLTISETMDHTRAFMKIQEGCDQFCTYCIVPYARGRVRSRHLDSIIAEATRLSDVGFKEIVLTGIHIASYGKEWSDGTDLLTVIKAVNQVNGIERIRLGSLEPTILTDDFVKQLSKVSHFCPHFHLSLQSGSDTVLQRMNRHYTTVEYAEIVQRIRKYFPHPALTTDIMVGFPGETDAEFEESLNYLKYIGFYQVHVFKYSVRKGTKAAKMNDQIDDNVKNKRSHRMIQVVEELESQFLKENDGLIVPVLFEQTVEGGFIEGHTVNYIPVYFKGDEKNCGKIIDVALSYNETERRMGAKAL